MTDLWGKRSMQAVFGTGESTSAVASSSFGQSLSFSNWEYTDWNKVGWESITKVQKKCPGVNNPPDATPPPCVHSRYLQLNMHGSAFWSFNFAWEYVPSQMYMVIGPSDTSIPQNLGFSPDLSWTEPYMSQIFHNSLWQNSYSWEGSIFQNHHQTCKNLC